MTQITGSGNRVTGTEAGLAGSSPEDGRRCLSLRCRRRKLAVVVRISAVWSTERRSPAGLGVVGLLLRCRTSLQTGLWGWLWLSGNVRMSQKIRKNGMKKKFSFIYGQ
ncbi:disease resistance protein [Striga asiatica]|uniref:Disease resistance protein n=1 Tax=Striga asiatica TaxID=4170 RepID=A0A5A7RIL3_STRAF|nr:disease resistance protein [Striga asiatica]